MIADPAEWDITADLTSNQLSLMEEGQGRRSGLQRGWWVLAQALLLPVVPRSV